MKKPYSPTAALQPIVMLASLSALTVLGWIWAVQPLLTDSKTFSAYPTGIPWIENEADCERSGRSWQEGICWDSEHDPTF